MKMISMYRMFTIGIVLLFALGLIAGFWNMEILIVLLMLMNILLVLIGAAILLEDWMRRDEKKILPQPL